MRMAEVTMAQWCIQDAGNGSQTTTCRRFQQAPWYRTSSARLIRYSVTKSAVKWNLESQIDRNLCIERVYAGSDGKVIVPGQHWSSQRKARNFPLSKVGHVLLSRACTVLYYVVCPVLWLVVMFNIWQSQHVAASYLLLNTKRDKAN